MNLGVDVFGRGTIRAEMWRGSLRVPYRFQGLMAT